MTEQNSKLNVFTIKASSCASSPATPDNGDVSCTRIKDIGSQCTFKCNPGYRLSGGPSMTCFQSNDSAIWSGPEPNCTGTDKCIVIHCPPFPFREDFFLCYNLYTY